MRTLKVLLRHRGAAIGLVGVLVYVILAVFAPWIAPANPTKQNLRATFMPPSGAHWFGTDQFGRDILSRVIYGSRTSLIVATAALGLAFLFGVPLGILAGYRGGWVEEAIMRTVDILLTFPDIFLAIIVAAIIPPGLATTILAIGIYNLPQIVRVARASALSVKENAYVEASRALGATSPRILVSHI